MTLRPDFYVHQYLCWPSLTGQSALSDALPRTFSTICASSIYPPTLLAQTRAHNLRPTISPISYILRPRTSCHRYRHITPSTATGILNSPVVTVTQTASRAHSNPVHYALTAASKVRPGHGAESALDTAILCNTACFTYPDQSLRGRQRRIFLLWILPT